MSELLKMKVYYTQLLKRDTPLIDKYGNEEDQKTWGELGAKLIGSKTKKEVESLSKVLGDIREKVVNENQDDHKFRLDYLVHGPETYEDIEKKLGKDIAEAVKQLRKTK